MFLLILLIKIGRLVLFPFEKGLPFIFAKISRIKPNISPALHSLKSGLLLEFGRFLGRLSKIKSKLVLPKIKHVKKPMQVPIFRTSPKFRMQKTFLLISWLFVEIRIIGGRVFKFYLIYVLGFISALVIVMAPYVVWQWWKELPNPELLIVAASQKPTRILDRKGVLLYEIFVDKKFEPVKLDQVPEHVIKATLAVEDEDFYNHPGISVKGMIRAAFKIITKESFQGGSTVTQQLIKNALLSTDRTLERKLKEVALALLVETKYSKDEILEMYLNNIPYGGTSWGIQAASHRYYGKDVWELSLAEAAMLAGLPTAPSAYSPITEPDIAKIRQQHVLDRMVEVGYLTQAEEEVALAENLTFVDEISYLRAPHFVDFVRRDLESKYGKRYVDLGGLTVTTTLDLDLQEQVQQIVKEEIAANLKLNITNGAAVVMDVKNSEILAYGGSVDYYRAGWGAFDVASAYRQPGSSIKPVTYALALSGKYTPASIIKDTPVTFQVPGSEAYSPKNYDNRYHGNVTLRSALANSYNIPAVRLARDVGAENIVQKGKDMGLTNWDPSDAYGLSVTLGGEEVRLVDHTNLFATLARGGVAKELKPYLSVKDSKGYEIYDNIPKTEKRVLGADVCYLIWSILSDNFSRIPAFGTQHYLSFPGHTVAAKTGTTDSKRDNWTMGYTPQYVVGVWVGNNDNSPMNQYLASGISGAAPLWHKIFAYVLDQKGSENEKMEMPDNVFAKLYPQCGNRSEFFIKGSVVPQTICPKPVEDKKDEDKEKKEDKDKD